MRDMKYVIYHQEGHYVAQCLNVDVSSFGSSIDEAITNIKEAVELYFEDNDSAEFLPIDMALIGEHHINE